MSMSRHYVLAAGGTGGHMMPAHALAEELMLRGHRVALITDDRGARIPGLFDKAQVHILPAGRISGGPAGWLRAARSILTGRATLLPLSEGIKRPHIGWSPVEHQSDHPALAANPSGEAFSFVHSYAATAATGASVATAQNGVTFVAAIAREKLVATQFHPEKSQDAGARLLKAWLAL